MPEAEAEVNGPQGIHLLHGMWDSSDTLSPWFRCKRTESHLSLRCAELFQFLPLQLILSKVCQHLKEAAPWHAANVKIAAHRLTHRAWLEKDGGHSSICK